MRGKPSDITKKILKESKLYIIIKAIICIIYRSIVIIIPMLLSSAINEATNKNFNTSTRIAVIALLFAIALRIFDVINTYTWHILYNNLQV